MTNDYIHRQTVLRCIKESRNGIDWGQSEDGDAFLHYSATLYRTVASKECVPAADVVPVVRCKDCKFRENDDFCTGRGFPYQLVPDDGFCDKGKRKE